MNNQIVFGSEPDAPEAPALPTGSVGRTSHITKRAKRVEEVERHETLATGDEADVREVREVREVVKRVAVIHPGAHGKPQTEEPLVEEQVTEEGGDVITPKRAARKAGSATARRLERELAEVLAGEVEESVGRSPAEGTTRAHHMEVVEVLESAAGGGGEEIEEEGVEEERDADAGGAVTRRRRHRRAGAPPEGEVAATEELEEPSEGLGGMFQTPDAAVAADLVEPYERAAAGEEGEEAMEEEALGEEVEEVEEGLEGGEGETEEAAGRAAPEKEKEPSVLTTPAKVLRSALAGVTDTLRGIVGGVRQGEEEEEAEGGYDELTSGEEEEEANGGYGQTSGEIVRHLYQAPQPEMQPQPRPRMPKAAKPKAGAAKKVAKGGRAAGGRKRRAHKESYRRYIHRVLKQVHPDLNISSKAMDVMHTFAADMFEKISEEAGHLARVNKRKTLTSREVQTAVRLVLPGQLAVHAVQEGNKAVARTAGLRVD